MIRPNQKFGTVIRAQDIIDRVLDMHQNTLGIEPGGDYGTLTARDVQQILEPKDCYEFAAYQAAVDFANDIELSNKAGDAQLELCVDLDDRATKLAAYRRRRELAAELQADLDESLYLLVAQ